MTGVLVALLLAPCVLAVLVAWALERTAAAVTPRRQRRGTGWWLLAGVCWVIVIAIAAVLLGVVLTHLPPGW